MITLYFRALFLYLFMVMAVRGMGKRQLGEYQPYELVMAILLADVVATPMESISTPLLYGIVPVAALFSAHGVITLLSFFSDKFRALFSGKASVVISKGVINEGELKRLCISLSERLEELRTSGFLDPAEVGTAIIEANGTLNAFPNSGSRPVRADEAGVGGGYEGLPLPLILNGRVQQHNLTQTGHDAAWLQAILSRKNLREKDVFFAYLDTQGRMTLQKKGGGPEVFQAVNPGEVDW